LNRTKNDCIVDYWKGTPNR